MFNKEDDKNCTMALNWIRLDSVPSTNQYLSTGLRKGTIVGETAVIADYQESGKGQGHHSWESESGRNLLMSLLLFPEFLSASAQFMISKVVSVSVCRLLEPSGVSPLIKWPNDIVTEKGKIAGILIEHGISDNRISHTIAGIGVNLNQTEFPEYDQPATSLRLESGFSLEPEEAGKRLARLILEEMEQLKENGGVLLDHEYRERLKFRDQVLLFRMQNDTFSGILRGVNDLGEIQVERDGKIGSYTHGEISW